MRSKLGRRMSNRNDAAQHVALGVEHGGEGIVERQETPGGAAALRATGRHSSRGGSSASAAGNAATASAAPTASRDGRLRSPVGVSPAPLSFGPLIGSLVLSLPALWEI